MKLAASTRLNVIARSPFHVYYEGPAEVISAINRIGPFDILPGHADFFSVLLPGEVAIDPLTTNDSNGDDDTKAKPSSDAKPPDTISFKISNGIITVRDDSVMLFVNM